ncbi:MAG: hypothetical protein ACRERS_09045, partial [Methylococcales bacterium]
MNMKTIFLTASISLASTVLYAQEAAPIVNPAIDMPAYLQVAQEAAAHRETHRLTEAEFIAMSREPNT